MPTTLPSSIILGFDDPWAFCTAGAIFGVCAGFMFYTLGFYLGVFRKAVSASGV